MRWQTFSHATPRPDEDGIHGICDVPHAQMSCVLAVVELVARLKLVS
jgi:hypothetical protein